MRSHGAMACMARADLQMSRFEAASSAPVAGDATIRELGRIFRHTTIAANEVGVRPTSDADRFCKDSSVLSGGMRKSAMHRPQRRIA